MQDSVAKIERPGSGKNWPIVVSVPHCGTLFPVDIHSDFYDEFVVQPVDTDWFVDQLYGFVVEMGITLVSAKYSRYVIDLNRSFEQKKLYQDKRQQSKLCPTHTFKGLPLYKDKTDLPQSEIDRRLNSYYWPYHKNLESEMAAQTAKHGRVLLFDAHSIARCVPEIRPEPFADVILGDNEGQSCAQILSQKALDILAGCPLQSTYNNPFRGGQITRYWGRPGINQHALQLEMSQDLYMDPATLKFDTQKAKHVQASLRQLFEGLYETLMNLTPV